MLREVAVHSTSPLDVPYSDVNDAPSLMRQDQKYVQDLKANGWYRKEVNRNHAADVVLKESSPSL